LRLPLTHIHVSERETAHRWPDGRWDNARWEDCAWDSAVELVRALGNYKIPATHAEAEALRAASGEDTHSGSNPDDVRRGILRRYKLPTNPVVRGWENLRARLKVGTVASVSGNMGVFSRMHRLRRHDRDFNAGHNVVIFKLDNLPRYWWCDPLGPKEGYNGEWVSEAELGVFVRGLAYNGHIVGALPPEPKPVNAALKKAIATIEKYIARLSAVKNKTKAQVAKLALYRKRLTDYLKRL
jgi:hypothetical protein